MSHAFLPRLDTASDRLPPITSLLKPAPPRRRCDRLVLYCHDLKKRLAHRDALSATEALEMARLAFYQRRSVLAAWGSEVPPLDPGLTTDAGGPALLAAYSAACTHMGAIIEYYEHYYSARYQEHDRESKECASLLVVLSALPLAHDAYLVLE